LNAGDDLQQQLAVATMSAMIRSLRDDHASWSPTAEMLCDVGFQTNITNTKLVNRPESALPPLYITLISGGAAKAAGLRVGDIIESIDGTPAFIDGVATKAAYDRLFPLCGDTLNPVEVKLTRPATGKTWTVSLMPSRYDPDPETLQPVSSKLLANDVAYVKLRTFSIGGVNEIFDAIAALRADHTLTGLVLDLRGNHGGDPDAVDRLLGAFVHNKVTANQCPVKGDCVEYRTDDSITLLNLPYTVLTDSVCASACEHFSSASKDLNLASLVGTRTAGEVSGSASPYTLSNYSVLNLPPGHHLGPDGETIDGIGVAPDYYVPTTAKDLSTGRDPALDKALALLK
jgi:carboxyl-terminal processing protease